MAGSEPGPEPQVVSGPDGTALADPVTDLTGYALPPDSPGGLLLAGPRAQRFAPRLPVPVRQVRSPAPLPGKAGRLVRLPDGRMGVTPSGLAAMPHLAIPAASGAVNYDPPLGANQVVQSLPDGSMVVLPLPPAYNGDDAGVINSVALQAGGPSGAGGVVRLGPWAYTCKSPVVLPQQSTLGSGGGGAVSLIGVKGATRLVQAFTGTLLSAHRSSGYGGQFGQPAQSSCGAICDVILDGAAAGPGSIGLDCGDGWGFYVRDVEAVNYTAAGCIGANLVNRAGFGTEKGYFRIHAKHCDTAIVIDFAAGTISHEYNEFEFYIFCDGTNSAARTQNGIVLQNGVNCAGCSFRIRGNMGGNTAPPAAGTIGALVIQGGSQIYASTIDMKVEGNGPNPGNDIIIDGTSAIQQCEAKILNSLAGPSFAAGSEFTARGMLGGSLGSVTTPAMPGASGTLVKNLGPDALVTFTALNSLTSVQLGTGPGTGIPLAGPFLVPAGGTITPFWSAAAPAWLWLPASQSQY